VKAGLIGLAAVFVSAMLLAAASGHAQSPPQAPLPAPGFMPPYEVTKMIRSAGFEPLAPPLREGTTYVLRATDFRGILMRVVVDARSGAIRAVNRIVPGPAQYGQVGMIAAPYNMPPNMPPAYGPMPPAYGPMPPAYGPPDADGSELSPEDAALGPPLSPASYPGVHSHGASPPLPRPRPAELAARDTRTAPKPAVLPAAQADEVPAAKPPQPKPSTTASTPSSPPPPVAPKRQAPSAIPD
jgi:hypothetical protein